MKASFIKAALAIGLAVGSAASRAEDIDLFIDSPSGLVDLPNVLFIIDNTANWNTAFSNEMSALINTLGAIPEDKFRIGIMFSAETGNPNNNVGGGYVRAAIRPMNATNKAAYQALVARFDQLADKGNGGDSGLVMAEAYRYFRGGTPYAGNNKAKTDYTGNVCTECTNLNAAQIAVNTAVYALGDNALASKSATQYNSPVLNGCQKNYIIFISNGPNQQNNAANALTNSMLLAAGGSTTEIALNPTGSQENPSDEWARFMYASDLNVVTYTIDVNPVTNGQGPGWTSLLQSMSRVSEGKYTAVSSGSGGADISAAINNALSEIQAVNGVFASVSLPVSVNTQGTYLNQVFVGMFRPDADALPRWHGNLKQYKLGIIAGELRLQDAADRSAINSLTGFITECARSFWTPSTVDAYWSYRPMGDCIPPAGFASDYYAQSNSPDGNIVEKGAQGYVLRSGTPASRNMKTCSATFASCTTLTNFNTANASITDAMLGATATSPRASLINWARGRDVRDIADPKEDGDGVTAEMRATAHGDVVHSRPVAINLGTDAAPQVVVFYGGNDGVLRAINGNRTDAIGSVSAGEELWSFMPPEFYGNIKRLYENTVQINFANVTDPAALPKPYGMDGAVSAHLHSTGAWIYSTMRRGGRVLYAFNIDKTSPTNITLKWKQGCPNLDNDTDCSTGFGEMGQSWASPKVLQASGYGSGATPLLVMGGGYDNCEDDDNCDDAVATPDLKGNQVYFMDADTGNLVRTFTTQRGVIADVVVVPDSITGLAKYAYVTDLGGNIYRIDIGTAAPASWSMTRIATLGCDTIAACPSGTPNRKFMFGTDVLVDPAGGYFLLVGSGDREKPRNFTNPVDNYFFVVQDDPGDATWLSSEVGNCGAAVLCLDSLLPITTATPTDAALATKKGWYLALRSTEQVVTSAITIFGVVTFSTHEPHVPTPGSCTSDLGTARVYNISYKNASSLNGTTDRSQDLPAVGLPPSPVAGMVTLDDGSVVPFIIGSDPDSPLESHMPVPPAAAVPGQPKGRVYWYIEQ